MSEDNKDLNFPGQSGGEGDNKQSPEEFYKVFKERLEISQEFPSNYTFKFIIPTDNKRIAELQRIFDDARPVFQMKSSSNGKYTSITAVIYAFDADAIIAYYQEAAKVENVIML